MISKFNKISIEEDGKRQQRERQRHRRTGEERDRCLCIKSQRKIHWSHT